MPHPGVLLLKLPLLAGTTWGINLAMTSPNPPPPPNERVERVGVENKYLPWFTTWVPAIGKKTFWVLALCESATILGIIQSPSKPFITPISVITSFMTVAGALIRRSCYHHLSTLFTFDLAIRPDHRLVTSGPYALVRHPSYVGAILSGVGAVMFTLGSRGSWFMECSGMVPISLKSSFGPGLEESYTLFPQSNRYFTSFFVLGTLVGVMALIILVPRMTKEDEMMKQKFGKEWEEWRARVRWRIVPGIY
ncbi:hypothetical protein E1B28_006335 [Marasmius oreades]|uniref:Protein-S-isoprenylcysteine O-methyltransferase n=1 Tax=Marasmius oreades TaxID=181124 RepID=A0A9P7S812_9AGAR|nr:uncharacterized protein E1B28_006335 [Marasmius oreades]KAG7095608.1 hypothetical protein E1B28_006335 [Marasmius oreades]